MFYGIMVGESWWPVHKLNTGSFRSTKSIPARQCRSCECWWSWANSRWAHQQCAVVSAGHRAGLLLKPYWSSCNRLRAVWSLTRTFGSLLEIFLKSSSRRPTIMTCHVLEITILTRCCGSPTSLPTGLLLYLPVSWTYIHSRATTLRLTQRLSASVLWVGRMVHPLASAHWNNVWPQKQFKMTSINKMKQKKPTKSHTVTRGYMQDVTLFREDYGMPLVQLPILWFRANLGRAVWCCPVRTAPRAGRLLRMFSPWRLLLTVWSLIRTVVSSRSQSTWPLRRAFAGCSRPGEWLFSVYGLEQDF